MTSIPPMKFASLSSSFSFFLKSEPQFIYDVFINFWGEDIGRKLVSHLHSALLQAQVKTLINEENLQEGMKLKEHMRGIAASKIAIIVFSKTYAESAHCLLELEKIIECHETFGQIVLPVFYEIDPLDVRYQKDDFGKALEEAAQKRYSGKLLEHSLVSWRCALTKASCITCLDVTNFRNDAELVDVTVSRVQRLLDYADLSIPHVSKIWIWRMGGLGKSVMENIKGVWDRVNRRHVHSRKIDMDYLATESRCSREASHGSYC